MKLKDAQVGVRVVTKSGRTGTVFYVNHAAFDGSKVCVALDATDTRDAICVYYTPAYLTAIKEGDTK